MSSLVNQDPPRPDAVRCPTCRAEQSWQPACRRCKSDLGLLREVAEAYFQARHACLARFRQRRYAEALVAALKCNDLSPGHESKRLLACMSLFNGDYATAHGLGYSGGFPTKVR
jgi:hypothetical protein